MNDQNTIVAILAVTLSLIFQFFPGVSTWFDTLSAEKKSLFIIVVMIAVAVGTFIGNHPMDSLLTWGDIRQIATDVIAALFSSQLNHLIVNKQLAPAKQQ